jgi:hypothetical protein
MPNQTYDNQFSRWHHLGTTVEDNADEVPHLVNHGRKLTGVVTEAQSAVKEQAALTASKQEKSQQVARLVAVGRSTAEFLITGLREHYGKNAEKLAAFKIQPRRARRAKPAQPPAPETAPPTAKAQATEAAETPATEPKK